MSHEHESAEPDKQPSTIPFDPTNRTADYDSRNADQVLAGRYRLIEPVGEGGMGTVWKAEQLEPVRRLVAVKLIKSGGDSRAVLARFEAERQALAMMDHPNIARVLDADVTNDGRPFFVMELVRGVPITIHCQDKKLTPQERLELFIPVCQAIQHAHQKGIIHRDIKPSNVLVTEYDGKPVPKVIDFGVAKAAGGRLTDSTLQTSHGAIVGTPEYMSPEQAADSADIDTRSDVYALGVLLYEMLTGSPPHDRARLKAAGLLEILRIVREEEPPPPSSKLSGIRVPNVQELDWIVLKALEKDRSRRYDSATALAADVQRHLANETVSAGPPGAGYRIRKFVRRHRGPVLAAGMVALALVAGFAGLFWGLIEARAERDAADAARAQALNDQRVADAARIAESEQRAKADAALKQSERDRAEKEREAIRADGLRLGAESSAALGTDPGLALRLAVEGVRRYPHHLTFAALYDSAEALHEFKTITGVRSPLALRPNGQGFACGVHSKFLPDRAQNRAVTLFDSKGNAGITWPGYGLEVGALAISPDGRKAATALKGSMLAEMGTKDQTQRVLYTCRVIYVWDTATGKDLLHLKGHSEQVVTLEFSPDGKRILSSSLDGTARQWDATTGVPIGEAMARNCSLLLARYSPDGSKILTVPSGQIAYENSWRDLEKLPEPPIFDPGPSDQPIRLLGPPSSNSGSASAGDDFAARIWSSDSTHQIAGLRRARSITKLFHNWTISHGRFSPDGTRVLLAFSDDVAGEWDASKTGSELRLLTGHTGSVSDARYSLNGQSIQSVGQDGKLQVYQNGSTAPTISLALGGGPVAALRCSKDERLRLVIGETGLAVWPNETGSTSVPLARLLGHQGRIHAAEFLDKDRSVVSLGIDGTARLWSVSKPAEIAKAIALGTPGVAAYDLSPDGKFLAVAGTGDSATIRIHDTGTGVQICEIGKDAVLGSITSIRFNPDGTQLITASDVTTGSRNGKVVNESSIHVWDARTGEEHYSLPSHVYGASFAAFLPDGRRIVTVSDGYKRSMGGNFSGSRSDTKHAGIVRIWEAATRKVAFELPQKFEGNRHPAISRDGRMIVITNSSVAIAFDPTNGRELWRTDGTLWPRGIQLYSGPTRAAIWGAQSLQLLDPQSGRSVFDVPKISLSSAPVYSSDGKTLALPVGEEVRLMEINTGQFRETLTGHEGPVRGIEFHRDDSRCLTFADDRTAVVWELPAGKLKTVYRSPVAIRSAVVLPNGGVATVGDDGIIRLWPSDPAAELLKRSPRELTDFERKRYDLPRTAIAP